MFWKKGVLRNFAKFTEKHLCQSLFLNKVAGLWPCNFIIKETLVQVFSVNFAKFLKTPFFTEHLWWLHLSKGLDFVFPPVNLSYGDSGDYTTPFELFYLEIKGHSKMTSPRKYQILDPPPSMSQLVTFSLYSLPDITRQIVTNFLRDQRPQKLVFHICHNWDGTN